MQEGRLCKPAIGEDGIGDFEFLERAAGCGELKIENRESRIENLQFGKGILEPIWAISRFGREPCVGNGLHRSQQRGRRKECGIFCAAKLPKELRIDCAVTVS